MLRVIGLPGKLLAINLRLWCLIPCLFFLTGALKGREGGELTLSVKTSSDCVESLLSCGTGTSAKDRSGAGGMFRPVHSASGGDGNGAAANA